MITGARGFLFDFFFGLAGCESFMGFGLVEQIFWRFLEMFFGQLKKRDVEDSFKFFWKEIFTIFCDPPQGFSWF